MDNDTYEPDDDSALGWAAHNTTGLVCGSLLVNLSCYYLLPALRGPLLLLMLACTGATVFLIHRHERIPCLRCAAKMSLNPSAEVERKHNRLVLVHRYLKVRYVVLFSLASILLGFCGPLTSGITWVLEVAVVAYALISIDTHSRLQPWCPFCREDGGDDGDVEAPDPVPTNESQMS